MENQFYNNETQEIDDLEENKRPYKKLDYTITDPQERNKIVHEIVDSVPSEKLTAYYLEELTKYLTETTENKKEKKILTNNRMVTINKRETSFEGLVEKFENSEDGIYNFITSGDKNVLLVPKIQITEDDIQTVPGLKELREEIKKIETKQKEACGKRKYLLTKQLIEMRQDQYVLKNAFKQPTISTNITKSENEIKLDENITIDENGEPVSDCLVSLFNPHHISCLLCNYSALKEYYWEQIDSDWWLLIQEFDKVADKALKEKYPVLYDIMKYKIEGLQSKEIIKKIKEKHDISYSIEYISTLWRKKIPKIIAEKAKEDWIVWHYTFEEYGKWKKCSRCHEIKLAHPYFFTRNKTAKDGFYSLCKECRNKKK